MIYYHLQTQSVLDAHFYLEELICLSKITNQKCGLKISTEIAYFFNLSDFDIIDDIPKNISTMIIGDQPHVYHEEMFSNEVLEFIGTKLSRFSGISRLDKYLNLDFVVDFLSPNFYENKYYSIQNVYQSAIESASNFSFDSFYLNKCEYYKNIFKPISFLILSDQNICNLPKKEFYYLSNSVIDKSIFEYNNVKAIDLKAILQSYTLDFPIEILLYCLSDHFEDIYGYPNDLLYALMCKKKYKTQTNWDINLLGCEVAFVEDFKLKTVYPEKQFIFAKKDLNVSRNSLCNFVRLNECCV